MQIELIDDIEEAREIWRDYVQVDDFPWPGDDHTYWRMMGGPHPAGIFSAVYRPEKGYIYLSSAWVRIDLRGHGLQRRMIHHRLRWGRRQGAIYAVTYTLLHNYESMASLLKCGFRFAREPRGWPGVGPNVHYFERPL